MDVADLVARERAGEHLEFVFFWGHSPKKGGGLDKSCLSQWYPAPFGVDGVTYPTAEHWMMAGKARACGHALGSDVVRAMLAARDPKEVKALGRAMPGYDDVKWTAARLDVVTRGSVHKFSQHPALRAFLLDTGDRVLVEASPTDAVWGIGHAEDDPAARTPSAWRGLNLLGQALMRARAELRARSP